MLPLVCSRREEAKWETGMMMATISRTGIVWLFAITLVGCVIATTSFRSRAAPDGRIDMVHALKIGAIELFNDSHEVQSALERLHAALYDTLSTDAVPLRFAIGDEGPHAKFLVTAWLGKQAEYGWTAEFVTAIVNTDSFGPPNVVVLNPGDLEKHLP